MKQRLFFAIGMAVLAWPALASEPFGYEVEIDAPGEVENLLRQHLEIVRSRTSERMSPEALERLIESTPAEAASLLQTEGYFTPRVTLERDAESNMVSVQVEPGEPVRVTKIHLALNGAIAGQPEEEAAMRRQILAGWPLPQGKVFNQSGWDAAKKRSLGLLQEKRYAGAKIIKSSAQIDPATHEATLHLELDSGPAYRFGPLEIHGLKHYPPTLVSHQAKFAAGNDYQRADLIDLQSSLHDLPHFSLVVVDTDLPQQEPFIAPVQVDIQEAPRHKLTTGLGYSTNTGFKTELGYRYLNLAERGWISESKLRLEQYEQAAETSVTFPRSGSGYQHRVNAGYLRSDVEGLLSHSWRTGIAREAEDFNLTRIWSLEYVTEQREFEDGRKEKPETLALKFQWLRRKVDNVRDPRRGHLLQGEIGGAYSGLLSDASFLRAYGRGVRYWPAGQRGVLIARGDLGQTFSREEEAVPTEWLFRTGGAGSVRGYDYQSLGVKTGGTVAPGRVMATGSLEYQLPVYREWRAAAFVDHGGAAARWGDFSGVTGAGLGARWVSPVGVLGADIARGFDEKTWRLHIALGLAF